MTILTVVQNACDVIGIARPTAVMTSTTQQIIQLRGLAQREGKILARRSNWKVLQISYSFSTGNGTASYALPSDFDHLLLETVFNRTTRRRMLGDLTPEEWEETQATLVTRVFPAFRIYGGLFFISPTPTATETIAYEYVSKNWCQTSGNAGLSAWVSDTDTGILDEELMTLGLIWRFKKAKGLDYGEDMQTYEIEVVNAMLRDGARRSIQTTIVEHDRIPHSPQVPETLTGLV